MLNLPASFCTTTGNVAEYEEEIEKVREQKLVHKNGKSREDYAKNKSKITLEKVDKAIRELSLTEQKINFNSVSQLGEISKTFLYNNEDVKQRIEEVRDKQISEGNHTQYV